jgi:hypothetical protein
LLWNGLKAYLLWDVLLARPWSLLWDGLEARHKVKVMKLRAGKDAHPTREKIQFISWKSVATIAK